MTLGKLADYTLTRELGQGGMGKVFLAVSPEGEAAPGRFCMNLMSLPGGAAILTLAVPALGFHPATWPFFGNDTSSSKAPV